MSRDPFLRRLEVNALVACAAMAVVALVLSRGRPGPPIAVLGGGVLIAFSYWTMGAGVSSLGRHHGRPRTAWIVARILARYALLVLLAYVMIARLRLHPLGLLAGASSVVAAASVEAVRLLLKKS